MQITRGKIHCGQKTVIYGAEGIGKTTLAAHFPNPVFIDTEGSTRNFDVARFPTPTSWEMLKSEAQYAIEHPDEVGTLVIDTADWAEKLCNQAVCKKAGKSGIEDFGYGKGYVYAAEEFGRLLDLLDRASMAGIHVVFTAHAQLRKVELPDDMGSYDKWELKCSKQLSPMLKEWADLVLFCNYKTFIVKSESGKGKAQGGQRMMYAAHHTTYDAKNRHDLPDEMAMEYGQIAHIFGSGKQASAQDAPHSITPPPAQRPAPEDDSAAQTLPEKQVPADTGEEPETTAPEPSTTVPDAPAADEDEPPFIFSNSLEGIHPPLADLLRSNKVTPAEIRIVVGDKGYFPADMPVQDYPLDFVEGCLIAAWPSVYESVLKDREGLPF